MQRSVSESTRPSIRPAVSRLGFAPALPAALTFLALLWIHSAAEAGPSRGLVAHYPLDTDFADASGNGNHATEVGAPVLVLGFRGNAVGLDGIDDVLETPRSIENDFSVAFWVQTTVIAPPGTDWWQGLGLVDGEVCGSPAGGDWGIALLNGGQVVWGSSANLFSASTVNDGLWHSVVVTRELSSGIVEIWVDGQLEISAIGAPTFPLTGSNWIGVGNNPCDVSFGRLYFAGAIDEVRYYERILSDSEAAALSDDWIHFDDFESADLTAWSSAIP